MSKRIVLSLVMMAALAPGAGAQVVGRIVGPGATRIELAVSPLEEGGGASGLGAKFAEVLRRNLSLSGYFRVLDGKAYIEGPSPSTPDQINWGSWRTIGAKALVKGTVSVSGGAMTVESRLFDVSQQQQLSGQRYQASPQDIARIARRFADQVMKDLTGELGPFDSRIAFASRRGGKAKEIFVMSVDGLDVTQVTRNRTINLAPSWSPDAGAILFTSYQSRKPDLWSYDLGTRAEKKLSAGGGLHLGGRWSPDAQSIAISIEKGGNSEITLLDPSGGERSRLTNSPDIDVSPAWSPDGRQIAFVSSRSGSPQVYVMGADGSGQRRVTFQGSYNTSPSWSPKGDLLAYVTRDGGFNVFTLELASNKVTQITSSKRNNEDPSFSPDGRYLIFSSTRAGRPALFLSDLTGSHQVQLTESGGDDTSPSWSPRLR